MTILHWLPESTAWRQRLIKLRQAGNAVTPAIWREVVELANSKLDFIATNALDGTIQAWLDSIQPEVEGLLRIRLALLGSSTLRHLHGGIRVAGIRHGLWISIYECDYGQYYRELLDCSSPLYTFKPDVVVFAQDAYHLTQGSSTQFTTSEANAFLEDRHASIARCWHLAREAFGCQIIQNTAMSVHRPLLGANEHRLPGSGATLIYEMNYRLRSSAQNLGVDLVNLDTQSARDGVPRWHDPVLWYRSKQEISPSAAPFYGDLIGRIIGARRGRSFKCLALDLDNTIWGGVAAEDGLEGIILGQGSALGESYSAFQTYLLELSRRGIVLAVCSKNDEAIALEVFERHPEMILRRKDIAVFKANWSDKATSLKEIALELNVGVDSIVFVDDNPVERAWVRRQLPMLAVPEVSEDPLRACQALADAGYFESVSITEEDRSRSEQYQANQQRLALRESSSDIADYLRDLRMILKWRRFDQIGLQRIVQLINKTNQFNLTTRRYTEHDVLEIMQSQEAFGLQLRLVDRFGDNGIVAICIVKSRDEELVIDTWLMSCRVLGRTVENATLNLLADLARKRGATSLIGEYIPTRKNTMVAAHYAKLGFKVATTDEGGSSRSILELR